MWINVQVVDNFQQETYVLQLHKPEFFLAQLAL
jgi:hypothetical protein